MQIDRTITPIVTVWLLMLIVSICQAQGLKTQTPQTFDIQLLKAANRQPYNDGFTDDASVVESYGHAITLVEGNRENIKITTPYDITVAEALITHHSSLIT